MATLRYEGKEIPLADDWRLDEQIEAENALKLDMQEARSAARMALVFYISMRRVEPSTPAGVLADRAMSMQLSAIQGEDEDEEGGQPAPLGDNPSGPPSETDALPTTGPRRLAS